MPQPTDERRRTGSHYTPRELTEPIGARRCGTGMPAGSGAFLVEACRQLAERLVESWARHRRRPEIPKDETELLYAKRLVATRCLYGVDRNPLTVELAELSLWLETLAKDHELTFLDHALRCGDSLVDVLLAQLESLDFDPARVEHNGDRLFAKLVCERLGGLA